MFEDIKDIVVEQFGVDKSEVVPSARLVDDLGADSFDLVEMLLTLEEEFDIEIADVDAEKWVTVADVVAYIETRVLASRRR